MFGEVPLFAQMSVCVPYEVKEVSTMRILFATTLCGLMLSMTADAQQFIPTKEPVNPDGTKAICDLPPSLHMKNTGGIGPGGPGTGYGLCVFTSIEVTGRWQNIPELKGLQKWMTYREGGGWPQKVDQVLAAFCKEKGVPVPKYIQHTGGDDEFLSVAMKTDRMVCVTYAGNDDFYRGTIAHMVVLCHYSTQWAAIADNNRPGTVLWMAKSDFDKRWRANGGGWAIVFLQSPPPPHPTDKVLTSQPCTDGKCQRPSILPPVGNPPSDKYEWGQFDDGRWGWKFKTKQPIEIAPEPKKIDETKTDVIENFGVDSSKIHNAERYSLPDGTCIPKSRAHGLIAGADLLDDSSRWHLTVTGDEAFLKKVKGDWEKVNPEIRSKFHIQFYTPDRWEVNHFRLPNGLSLRKPSPVRLSDEVGVLNVGDYTLEQLLNLLKLIDGIVPKPVPAPQPTPVPSPTPVPTPEPDPSPTTPNWPLIVIIGLIVLYFVLKRKKAE